MQPQSDTEERLERIETPKNKNNENDTVTVKNIDIDCHDVTYDSVRVSERWRDPESGRVLTQFKDQSYQFDHIEGFQVRWSGQPFTLKPGEMARMPRFLAEHFAQHLADHMLDKKGLELNRALRNDPIWRPKILKEIIISEEPFFSTMGDSVGQATLNQVRDMNDSNVVKEFGDQSYADNGGKGKELSEAEAIPKDSVQTTVGKIDKTSVEPTEEVVTRIGTETETDKLNIPADWEQYTKTDLIEQIRNMDPYYKFGSTYTKAQLVSILQSF